MASKELHFALLAAITISVSESTTAAELECRDAEREYEASLISEDLELLMECDGGFTNLRETLQNRGEIMTEASASIEMDDSLANQVVSPSKVDSTIGNMESNRIPRLLNPFTR